MLHVLPTYNYSRMQKHLFTFILHLPDTATLSKVFSVLPASQHERVKIQGTRTNLGVKICRLKSGLIEFWTNSRRLLSHNKINNKIPNQGPNCIINSWCFVNAIRLSSSWCTIVRLIGNANINRVNVISALNVQLAHLSWLADFMLHIFIHVNKKKQT